MDWRHPSTTWSLLIPAKEHVVAVLLHPAVAGLLTASATVLLEHGAVRAAVPAADWLAVLGNSLVFGLGWASVCLGVQAMAVAPPPETATFRHVDSAGLTAFSRPVHILACHVPMLMFQLQVGRHHHYHYRDHHHYS